MCVFLFHAWEFVPPGQQHPQPSCLSPFPPNTPHDRTHIFLLFCALWSVPILPKRMFCSVFCSSKYLYFVHAPLPAAPHSRPRPPLCARAPLTAPTPCHRARGLVYPPPLLWWSCLRTEAGILCVLLSPATTTAPHAHAHHTTSACPSL